MISFLAVSRSLKDESRGATVARKDPKSRKPKAMRENEQLDDQQKAKLVLAGLLGAAAAAAAGIKIYKHLKHKHELNDELHHSLPQSVLDLEHNKSDLDEFHHPGH